MDKDTTGIILMVIGLNIASVGGSILLLQLVLPSDISENSEFNPYLALRNISPVFGAIILIVGFIIFIFGVKTYIEAEKEAKLRKKSGRKRHKRSHKKSRHR